MKGHFLEDCGKVLTEWFLAGRAGAHWKDGLPEVLEGCSKG
jgi:hypothetical protein